MYKILVNGHETQVRNSVPTIETIQAIIDAPLDFGGAPNSVSIVPLNDDGQEFDYPHLNDEDTEPESYEDSMIGIAQHQILAHGNLALADSCIGLSIAMSLKRLD